VETENNAIAREIDNFESWFDEEKKRIADKIKTEYANC